MGFVRRAFVPGISFKVAGQPYEIISVLGAGAFGAVFRARGRDGKMRAAKITHHV